MDIDKMITSMHPRTRPTLENLVRMAIHPTGTRDFCQATADDLGTTKSLAGKVLIYSGAAYDSAKFLTYGMCLGTVLYQAFLK